jgi:transcriptional regulator with GAF, ATPase, and Fis domain
MLVGRSSVMVELRSRISRVAETSFTVLIEGESGVGKELVARELHIGGPRRRGPFVAVNCAALVETLVEAELFGIEDRTATGVRGRRGKFEMAEDGTLFLDEVADLSPSAQAKLLRVLQDLSIERVGGVETREVNTRIIAATNRTLIGQVTAGRFRADLFYRLSGVEIYVPPLRARREDIPVLVAHFLNQHRVSRPISIAASAVEALTAYDWPGNVRQLERVLERREPGIPRPAAGGAATRRFVAGLEQPLRACDPRSLQRQQAARVRGAWHHVPHPAVAAGLRERDSTARLAAARVGRSPCADGPVTNERTH